jgi:hypothetical protein
MIPLALAVTFTAVAVVAWVASRRSLDAAIRGIIARKRVVFGSNSAFEVADAQAFPWLNLARYDELGAAFEARAFTFIADLQGPLLRKRGGFLRALVGDSGAIVASVSEILPVPTKPSSFDDTLKPNFRIVLETELGDGRFVITSNDTSKIEIPTLVWLQLPHDVSVDAIVSAHREAVAAAAKRGDREPAIVRISTVDDAVASNERKNRAVREHWDRVGWVSVNELERAGFRGKHAKIVKAIRRVMHEEGSVSLTEKSDHGAVSMFDR